MLPALSFALLLGSLPHQTPRAGTPPAASEEALPPRAYSVGAAYDTRRERLVIFGGKRPGPGYVNATWEHASDGWHEVATGGPSARNSPVMAYDDGRGVTVLFGGDDARGALGDTWEWDGRAWRQPEVQGPRPPARSNARLAYDAGRRAVVLFGGIAGQTVLGDAWQWDGRSWTLVSADGPPRFLHGFAVTDKGWVTFGGCAEPPRSAPPPPDGQTWTASDGSWKAWRGDGPGDRDHLALAYDPLRRRAVFYGGFLEGEPMTETWEWDGSGWDLVPSATNPGQRGYPALVYDPARKCTLLYGGFDASGPKNDLWAWDGKAWKRVG